MVTPKIGFYLSLPHTGEDDHEERELDADKLEEHVEWQDGYPYLDGNLMYEELYFQEDSGELRLTWNYNDMFGCITLPVLPTDHIKNTVGNMHNFLGLPEFENGLVLEPDRFSEVLEKEVDDQGRLTAGKKYAGKTVKAVLIVEDGGDNGS